MSFDKKKEYIKISVHTPYILMDNKILLKEKNS